MQAAAAGTLHRFYLILMDVNAKSKPNLLQSIKQQSSAMKARTVTTETESSSSIKHAFGHYASYLNDLNEKGERVVKASRDIATNSKKVIFQVHRMSKNNREEVLSKAEKDLAAVTDQYMARLVKELQGTDF